MRLRATWCLVVVLVGGGVGSRAWGEDTPAKRKQREAALAAADKEVGQLWKLVKSVDQMAPCAAPATGKQSVKGRPYCPAGFLPIKTKIKAYIEEADSVAEGDPKTGWVKSNWHNYLESFGTVMLKLSEMKDRHHSPQPVGKQCKAISDGMIARAKAAGVAKSLDQFEAARSAATTESTLVKALVSKQVSTEGEMAQLNKDVKTFELRKPDTPNSYDVPWNKAIADLRASAKKMLMDWNKAWTPAELACREPAKGEDHAKHRVEEDKMYKAMRKDLDTDLKKWQEDTKAIYRLDCDAMKKIHDLYCSLDGDGEEAEQKDKVDEEVDKLAQEQEPKAAAQILKLEDLVIRAGALEAVRNGRMEIPAYQKWRENIQAYITEVVKGRLQLERTLDTGIAKGTRNSLLQDWISYGVQRHKEYEARFEFECAVTEKDYCAHRDAAGKCEEWRRPDCISSKQCTIWEFKPPGGDAKQRGLNQLAAYKEIIETHYNFALGLYRKNDLTYEPIGGREMLLELAEKCAPDGGDIVMKTALKQYERCNQLEYTCGDAAP